MRRTLQAYIQKHLHIRGADLKCPARFGRLQETPPHTWSRPSSGLSISRRRRKHLHIRGADLGSALIWKQLLETPPHTWSRLDDRLKNWGRWRNTSTYVEQTRSSFDGREVTRKHLHIRGADALRSSLWRPLLETPPHTWSRRLPAVSCSRH